MKLTLIVSCLLCALNLFDYVASGTSISLVKRVCPRNKPFNERTPAEMKGCMALPRLGRRKRVHSARDEVQGTPETGVDGYGAYDLRGEQSDGYFNFGRQLDDGNLQNGDYLDQEVFKNNGGYAF